MAREKKYRPRLTFVQDSREQCAFSFGALLRPAIFQGGGTEIETLGEGDYSVRLVVEDGQSDLLPIRIERKSHGDLAGVCGFGRERFERELERLRAYEYAGLIVEASLDDILRGYERSRIPGRTVAASLIAWGIRYRLHVWLAETHRRGAAVCQRILEQAAVDWWEAKNGG